MNDGDTFLSSPQHLGVMLYMDSCERGGPSLQGVENGEGDESLYLSHPLISTNLHQYES